MGHKTQGRGKGAAQPQKGPESQGAFIQELRETGVIAP